MPNIVSQTQHPNSPPPKQNSPRNIEEFLSKEVGVPLTLGKIQIYKDPSPAKSINGKRALADLPIKECQTEHNEVHFGADYLSTVASFQAKAPAENNELPSSLLEGLVDQVLQTIQEKVERIVSLLYDQFQDPKTSHSVFVERTYVCRELRKEIQDLATDSFRLGLATGRDSGSAVVRKILGDRPQSTRIYKFSSLKDHLMSGGSPPEYGNHRTIGVKLELTSDRISCEVPHLEQQARSSWALVEKQVSLLVQFKLRSILTDMGSWSENTKHTRECISNAITATFDAGKYRGYHYGQEKYKDMYGVSNPWTYSFTNIDSEGATVFFPREYRPTPKIVHPSFAKRQRNN